MVELMMLLVVITMKGYNSRLNFYTFICMRSIEHFIF